MRYLFAIVIVLLFACNRAKRNDQAANKRVSNTRSLTQKDSIQKVALVALKALKAQDYSGFASCFHPTEGVRFSPYGFVDFTHKQTLAKDFLEAINKNWILTWGHYDGSGAAIKLRVKPYIQRYIYNADYLTAEKKAYDSFIGGGNSINNLKEVYPQLHFTEYYFKGFDKKYTGLDWSSLKFVFKKYQSNYYLVAVIHDQWTA
ncbi:hypothetical protein ASE74_10445 [Pedobacter sp. Leaf216]|uniref:hypothetical protein n=1 Tax=Pedobacter sp. Leaf216 TaxID=1735684 RepID=UPI0006FDBC36|nr:hypothetical protein [Pedobacter sp. Leaf216]KQM65274.1 hypothetical protein ASE74_10445 [Pedobacter sp. Leaf216]